MQDYRNEIKEFFTLDKQLAAELEYDMKKYEEQLEREAEQDQELSVDHEGHNTLVARPMDEASPPTQSNSPPLRSPLSPRAMFNVPGPGATKPRARYPSGPLLFSAREARKCASSVCNGAFNLSHLSSVANRPLEGRAVSTPEQSINDVTFGAGVSQISLNLTGSSSKGRWNPNFVLAFLFFEKLSVGKATRSNTPSVPPAVKEEPEASQKQILCLTSPDK
ncbi:hypothetical protein E2320_007140, partial [Naja naja]